MDALTKTDPYVEGVWCTLNPYGDIGLDPDVRPFLNANRVIVVKRTKSGLIQVRLPGDYKTTISVPQRNVDIIPAERLRHVAARDEFTFPSYDAASFIDYDGVQPPGISAARSEFVFTAYQAVSTPPDLEYTLSVIRANVERIRSLRLADARHLYRLRLRRRLLSNHRIKWRGQLIRATPYADTRRYLIEVRKRCLNSPYRL